MRFRANLFGGLFWLTALGMIVALVGFSQVGSQYMSEPSTPQPYLSETENRAIKTLAVGITGAFYTPMVCGAGSFFLLFFGLLSWRNAAGARAEQRHQDLLAIERERNWIMQGGQLRSTRNTPSAYEEEPLDRLFPERRANMERLERMRREGKLTSEAEKIWSQSPRPPAREDFYNAMFPDRKEDPKRVSGSIQNTKRKR